MDAVEGAARCRVFLIIQWLFQALKVTYQGFISHLVLIGRAHMAQMSQFLF